MSYELPHQLADLCQIYVQEEPDTGACLRHHRSADWRVGCTHFRPNRSTAYLITWYADCLPGRTFTRYEEMWEAFMRMPTPRHVAAHQVLADWPKVRSLDKVPVVPGHALPQCTCTRSAFATHIMNLELGWHPIRHTVVYLGVRAMRQYKALGVPYLIQSHCDLEGLLP